VGSDLVDRDRLVVVGDGGAAPCRDAAVLDVAGANDAALTRRRKSRRGMARTRRADRITVNLA
ncbi:MAG: hypothetical protein ACRENC_09415, partial [Gemmatimonadaceae bacterium]